MRPDASYWIKKLQLTQHVEGGAFRETYRSELTIPRTVLPLFFQGDRNASTSIYFHPSIVYSIRIPGSTQTPSPASNARRMLTLPVT